MGHLMIARAGSLRRPRAIAAEPVVHVGYHKTASTWLQFCVFPLLRGIRYGEPPVHGLAHRLATATNDASLAADLCQLRRIARHPDEPLLLSSEGISGSLWDGDGSGLRNAARLHRALPGAR